MAAALDSKLHLRVVATGHPGVTLSYQWLRDTKPLEYALSPDLVIPRVSLKDFGAYNCRVTSDLGVSVLTPSCMVSRECVCVWACVCVGVGVSVCGCRER